MRNQAVLYIEDTGISGKEREVPELMEEVRVTSMFQVPSFNNLFVMTQLILASYS